MKENKINAKKTVLSTVSRETVESWKNDCFHPSEKQHFSELLEKEKNLPEESGFIFPFAVKDKKTGEELGYIQFDGVPKEGHAEINCTVLKPDVEEKIVSDALKAAAGWAFAEKKELMFITTWLSPDLTATKILEGAGFERVFESDGLVRYEKHRPVPSFLAIFISLFLLLGFALGYFFDNYPLFVVICTCIGILPGALVDHFIKNKRMRNRSGNKK